MGYLIELNDNLFVRIHPSEQRDDMRVTAERFDPHAHVLIDGIKILTN